MADIPRLNGVIRAWQQGKPAFSAFCKPDWQSAQDFSVGPYDAVIFEMEHNPWDAVELQHSMQYLLNRKQIASAASLAPKVTPIVRIPPNGSEMNQSFAKQALDRGAYGIVWPHISNAGQAYNAVASCRYPRPKSAPQYEPVGARGDAPNAAARYWGLSLPEYYARADVWPLNPLGEILVFLMIEDVSGVDNLDDILRSVPGIGCILIGEGDLSQELGVPRQYEHPLVVEAMQKIVATCKRHKVPVGHPHVDSRNIESVLAAGYQFIMSAPVKSYAAVEKGRTLAESSKA